MSKWGLSPFLPGRPLVAFLAGAAMVLAFAPFELLPVALVALAVLVHLWITARSARTAAGIGFLFGMGMFLAGVSWVYISLHRYGAMPAPLAAIATLGFCVVLSAFPALAGYVQARTGARPALRAALVIPACWVLAEWLRGTVLTGFPWLTLGNAAPGTPLAGISPIAGAYGASLVLVAGAGLLWCVALRQARWRAAVAFAVIGACGAAARDIEWTLPHGAPLTASVLQGNVPQEMKFDPQRYAHTLDTYARLAEASHARLIVLPETAVPRLMDSVDPAYLDRLEAVAKRNGGDLLLGIPVRTAPREYFNAVLSLGSAPRQLYFKSHLVPFGEFVPWGFGWIVRVLSIPLGDFTRGPLRPAPLEVAGERVAVNICYEDAYGAEILRQLPSATLLVNASNVAWFGDSLAPAQHLQIARARALETGRAHLTATNTGITAAIGRDGRVLARLASFSEGRLDVEVQPYTGATPYVRTGDWPVLLACAAVLALFARRRRSR